MLAANEGNFHPLGVDERKTPFPLIEPGTSPVGIGGVLSTAPAALYPEINGSTTGQWSSGAPSNGRADNAGSIPASRAEPLYLNLYLETLGSTPKTLGNPQTSLVEAASIRVASQGGVLSESEMIAVLRAVGWPTELIPQALAVSYCESKWSPYALGDSGRSAGLFQVNRGTWFPYAGEDGELWADPVVNARVALRVYYYDVSRGQRPWQQWSCQP